MEKYEFPLTFACTNPKCGSEDTLAELLRPKDKLGFVYLTKEAEPLQDPRVAILTIRMCVRYFDQCAKCGTSYCTKIEIQQAPIKAVPKGQVPGQGPFFKG